MNQKHFTPGLSLFIAAALLVSYPEAMRKPEPKKNPIMQSEAEFALEATQQDTARKNIIVCLESINITRGACRTNATGRHPDILTIRLSLCNEEKQNFANVVAQILASNIRFCGDPSSRCTGISERVYFETINGGECARAKTPCRFTDAGGAHNVAFPIELQYKINNLPARGKLCLSFMLELFLDDSMNCQMQAFARADILFQKIGISTTIPVIPFCPNEN